MLGATVYHYRILGRLGAGGMGEVYRARDERLGREVAIKALPEEMAANPERLRRLRAEARAMAAVDHPHVATIHAVEEHEGRVLLILEMVEGETLAARLKRGALPVAEAQGLARQVAAGLAAAHARGIVHRDLKPSNVMLGAKGQAKILDFGLAKALATPRGADEELDSLSTQTLETVTKRGAILGTAPYLSPEQARGEAVDERTDVWAFGCLLYEMLTGRRAFPGSNLAENLAAIVEREPAWEALPAATPGTVRWLLRRCLEKDPDRRLHAVADAWLLLAEGEEPPPGEGSASATRGARTAIGWAAGLAVAGLVGFGLGWRVPVGEAPQAAEVSRIVRFSLIADADDPEVSFTFPWWLSPDDRVLAYQTVRRPGARKSAIFLRSLEDGSVSELAGTAGASSITFSPGGLHLAFLDGKSLKRVSLRDGTVETVATLGARYVWPHLVWADEGSLFVSSWIPRGLREVAASGGELEGLSFPDHEILEPGTDQYASFLSDLPGSGALLLTLRRLPREDHLEFLSLVDGERRTVTQVGSGGMFVPPGYLSYYHQGKLFAATFDPKTGGITGDAVAVLSGVTGGDGNHGLYSVSRRGSLVYSPARDGGARRRRITVARRGGETEELSPEVADAIAPRVSPDGTRIVVSTSEDSTRANLWLYDLQRNTTRRLTGEEGNEWWSAWGADGRLAFQSDREDGSLLDLYLIDPDQPGSLRKVLDGGECYLQPQEWTPAGRLLFQKSCVASGTLDLYSLDVDSGEVRSLRQTSAREKHPSVSPDGQWLAFVSDLSGEDQVYLTSYPQPGRLLQVSPAGGDGPIWAPSGEGLYFLAGTDLHYVPFDAAASNPLGAPQVAVTGVAANSYVGRAYDIFPDGRIVFERDELSPTRELRVVLNWSREVGAKLAQGN